jgi:GWxTD domain-containing protein
LNVRASANLTIPATYGSTFLFPADWPQWNVFKRDAVLLHEVTHVRRHDFHIHLLADIFRSVFWFNPMAWWLRRELLELAEAACDDEAIRKVGDRMSYAEVLIEFASKGSVAGFAGVPMASGRTVAGRVERMLRGDSIAPQTSLLRRAGLIAAFVPLVGIAAGFWQVRAATTPIATVGTPVSAAVATPVSAQRPPQAEPTNFLAKWPEEEVPYLIAAEERDAFQKLRTDEEREQFINAFWLRRDPSPGTLNNEYRDEYYRRIVVANQRFTTPSGTPGWRTDRGRIWIMNGPPDEIETHAQGGAFLRDLAGPTVTVPFERWRYRHIEGRGYNIILEFVDTAKDGAYHLDYDPSAKGRLFSAPKP